MELSKWESWEKDENNSNGLRDSDGNPSMWKETSGMETKY